MVLERGRIVEVGTHEELLARDGLYANLYKMTFTQMGDGRSDAGAPEGREDGRRPGRNGAERLPSPAGAPSPSPTS